MSEQTLREALEHIRRMAGGASRMTHRLIRIHERASAALEGRAFDPEHWQEPKTRVATWVGAHIAPPTPGWYLLAFEETGEMQRHYRPSVWTGDKWELGGMPASIPAGTKYLSARLPNKGLGRPHPVSQGEGNS